MARLVCALLLLAVAAAAASENRVVGGWPTIIEHYPYTVQVQRQLIGIWTHRGAGCILTSRYILSSAFNFRGPTIIWKQLRINAGSTYRSVGGQISGVSRVIAHPTWFEGINRDGDIAIVMLETPLQYSNVVQQAAILGPGVVIPDNLPSTVVGWGADFNQDFPHLFSDVLIEKHVYTVNNQRCALNYANAVIPATVTSNMVCAGGLDTAGACIGDNGGPLVANGIVMGVRSNGRGCTNSTYPGIFSALPSFTQWIIDNVS